MREIERSNQFKHDYKRELRGLRGRMLPAELEVVVQALANDRPLAARYRDHALSGQFIYAKPDARTLQLVRLGSHSELFH